MGFYISTSHAYKSHTSVTPAIKMVPERKIEPKFYPQIFA
jgi:hypothetical protein